MFDFPNTPTTGQTVTMPDGTVRSWDGAKWVAASYAPNAFASVAYVDQGDAAGKGSVGRNLIHNSMMNVQQRGQGSWTANAAYTADRWVQGIVGGTLTTSIGAVNDTNRTQIGDEAAAYHFVANVTGGAGATDETYFEQRIEGLRRTSGKTVILSFWAASTAGTPKLGIPLFQLFGSGGSPSAAVLVGSQAVTLSTTYTRYSLTYAVPSVSGKTFGTTTGTDYLAVRFGLSCGASNNVNYASIGQQSFVLAIWGIQLEIAQPGQTQPTPLDGGGDYGAQLRACQRFYQIGQFSIAGNAASGGGASGNGVLFPCVMRGTPTIAIGATLGTDSNASGVFTDTVTTIGLRAYVTGSVAGYVAASRVFTASADL